MVTPLEIQTKFDGIKTRKGKQIYTATPTGSSITVVGGKSLNYAANQYVTEDDATHVPTGGIPEAQAAADITLIKDLFKQDHGDVKFDSRWRHMYMAKPRIFTFVNPQGNEFGQPLASYPCHYCGLLLPDYLIEVDHRQPQAHPGIAVLKVLHSMSGPYTTAHGAGHKAAAAGAIAAAPAVAFTPPMQATIQTLPTIPPKGIVSGAFITSANLALDPAKMAKYTITPQGQTFLGLCKMFLDDIQKYCVNSLLNLVPSCPLCNGAAGKGSKIHSQGMQAF